MYFLPLLQGEIGCRKDRTTQRGRSPGFPRVLAHIRMAQLSGHELAGGVGLLAGLWRAIAPLKPWCAEGDVPTAANLNLYRGWKSRVGWHSDNEPLFGERGDSKLIVSVSFGTRAPFRWKGKSCPDSEASSCCLGHGDILVVDAKVRTSFFTVRIPVWRRRGFTLRSVGSGNILFPVPCGQELLFAFVCAGFICCRYKGCGERRFLGLLGALCIWGYQLCWCTP